MAAAPFFRVFEFSLARRIVSSAVLCGVDPADEPKTQGTRDRRRLDQFDRHRVTQPLDRRPADKGMTRLDVAEILNADMAGRDQTVGAGLVELDEQTGAGHAGNVPVKNCADTVRQKVSDQSVSGFAFRLHGTPLGGRDICRHFGERPNIRI